MTTITKIPGSIGAELDQEDYRLQIAINRKVNNKHKPTENSQNYSNPIKENPNLNLHYLH